MEVLRSRTVSAFFAPQAAQIAGSRRRKTRVDWGGLNFESRPLEGGVATHESNMCIYDIYIYICIFTHMDIYMDIYIGYVWPCQYFWEALRTLPPKGDRIEAESCAWRVSGPHSALPRASSAALVVAVALFRLNWTLFPVDSSWAWATKPRFGCQSLPYMLGTLGDFLQPETIWKGALQGSYPPGS